MLLWGSQSRLQPAFSRPTNGVNPPFCEAQKLYSAESADAPSRLLRIGSNLTLTMGVRNEMSYHPAEQYNRFAMFTPNLPGGGIVVACSGGQLPTGEFNPGVVSKLTNAQGKFNFPIACGSSLGYDPHTLVENHPWNLGFAWAWRGIQFTSHVPIPISAIARMAASCERS